MPEKLTPLDQTKLEHARILNGEVICNRTWGRCAFTVGYGEGHSIIGVRDGQLVLSAQSTNPDCNYCFWSKREYSAKELISPVIKID